MAGHSKWHNIQHRKGAQDKIRAKLFTKHAKLISIAAKNGSDLETNSTLKTAVFNAKADNVPNSNIDRAIKKGSGDLKNATNYQELLYEAYAPSKVAVLISVLTDNTNRTFTNVKTIVTKNGGNMGQEGSVSWMFQVKGTFEILLENKSLEDLEMDLLETKAENFEVLDDRVFVVTALEDLNAVSQTLSKKYRLENIQKNYLADNKISLNEDEEKKFENFLEKLEDDEDVTDIFHNAE
jgi:YebC/PmpR family DNA-binding regulatory protein